MDGTFDSIKIIIQIIGLVFFIVSSAVIIFINLKYIIAEFIIIHKNVWKGKRKALRKTKRQWTFNILLRILLISMAVVVIIFDCRNLALIEQQISVIDHKEKEAREAVSQKYLATLSNIPFQDEVLNKKTTLWEDLLNEGLMYKEYSARSEENFSFAELRSCYQGTSDNIVEWPEIDIDMLVKQIKEVYGSELLPVTEADFEEVNDEIKSYGDPLMVPAEVYKAEFWIRLSMEKDGFSSEALYQIGRASDDVLKVLKNSNKITIKEWIFFGSMAVSFYLASMECDDGSRDLPLTHYRIAEIFIYLDKYSPLKNDEAYSRHFRLMAEKALEDAEHSFDNTYEYEKIKRKLPYFYCYYAEILYDFSRLCPNNGETLAEMCKEYASRCVMGETEEECCTSCSTLSEKLK